MEELGATAIVHDPFLQTVLHGCDTTRQSCIELLNLIDSQILPHGRSQVLVDQSELTERRQDLLANLANLRGLNRNAIYAVRDTKASTAESRQEMDRLHLHLQNLFYEERHLLDEIAACKNYNHLYQQLPMIPADQFLEKFPEHRDLDEKGLTFARIEHERGEREILEQQRQELFKEKQRLAGENKKRKDDLASLDQDLEKFIDAAKPIQKIFEKSY